MYQTCRNSENCPRAKSAAFLTKGTASWRPLYTCCKRSFNILIKHTNILFNLPPFVHMGACLHVCTHTHTVIKKGDFTND